MRVRVRGGNENTRKQIKHAAKWYGDNIVGYKLADNVYVRIDLIPNLQIEERCYARVVWLKTNHRPRHFAIEIDSNLKKKMMLKTLAHEFVHIRQYTRDHLKDLYNCTRVRWHKKIFSEQQIDTLYKTLPWELEAHKLEKHFYHAYARFCNGTSKKQKASSSFQRNLQDTR
jgi:hypothetical protein